MKHLLLTFVSVLLICTTSTAYAQDRRISGQVTSPGGGSVLRGVSVQVKGTSRSTQTDSDGRYSILVPTGPDVSLVFSYLGFLEKEVSANAPVINVVLEEDRRKLDEIVVVAYGTQKRESVTGSIASVSAEDIAKRPITNVMGALEGAAAGIQVNNTSGQPGAEPVVRIRGFTSVDPSNPNSSANNPLYVIDGAIFSGNYSDLNPGDIESLSVLKDAAATALYGNRASNGVIIITTKKGKGSAPRVNASVNQGFYSRGVNMYDRVGDRDYMEIMWKGYRNSLMTDNPTAYPTAEAAGAEASNTLISDILISNIYNVGTSELFDSNGKLNPNASIKGTIGEDLDWFKHIETIGHRQDYSINGNQGGPKSNIYYSAGYLDEKGYVKHTDFKRFTGRMNAEMTPVDWFKYGMNVGGSHQIQNTVPGSEDNSGSYVSPYYYGTHMSPIYTVYKHDPVTGEYVLDANGNKQYEEGSGVRAQNVGRHTIWENELNRDMSYRNTINGQVYFDVNFLKDFTFSVKGDLNVRNNDRHTYNNAEIGDGAGNNGRASRTNYRYKNYMAQQLLNWRKNYGRHNVTAMVGHENFYSNYNYLYGYKTNESFAGSTELINFTEITSLTDYQVDYRTEGYFGRSTYSFDDRYFAEASFRRDASSKFSPESRWGNFWSVGGSWLISKEKFFRNYLGKVNDLKLRVAYGEVGNDANADTYAYQALYTMSQNGGASALYKTQNEAPSLLWETSSSVGMALEGRLFNRVNFIAEYFDKRSQNLIFDVNMPLSAGATSTSSAVSTITQNIGSVSNYGWEFTVDADIVRNRDWRWNVGVNATLTKNKVVRLAEENREEGIISGNYRYAEGESMYSFWMYHFVGVDQLTGNALYELNPEADMDAAANYLVDINGTTYTTNTTYGIKSWQGKALPDVYGSFSTALSYKNITLSGLFTYSLGGKVYDNSYASLMSVSASPSAIHADVLKAWDGVPTGMTETSVDRIDPNGTPVVNYTLNTYNNTTSDRFLVDRSYFVIKNIALAYRVPEVYLNPIGVRSLSLNMGIENLASFTKLQGMNPQQNFSGSNSNAWITPRIVSFGVNIGL